MFFGRFWLKTKRKSLYHSYKFYQIYNYDMKASILLNESLYIILNICFKVYGCFITYSKFGIPAYKSLCKSKTKSIIGSTTLSSNSYLKVNGEKYFTKYVW